jgi:hypothetical protein
MALRTLRWSALTFGLCCLVGFVCCNIYIYTVYREFCRILPYIAVYCCATAYGVYGLRVYAVDLSVYRDPRAAGALLENATTQEQLATCIVLAAGIRVPVQRRGP